MEKGRIKGNETTRRKYLFQTNVIIKLHAYIFKKFLLISIAKDTQDFNLAISYYGDNLHIYIVIAAL